jgi:predicted DsbA family dithiol-disulfide isomerase
MGGLLPGWNNYNDTVNSVSRPAQMGPVWMHASHISGMHIENNIWMKDPPASSYPACIAVKCAQLQSQECGEAYLRLLRENVMLKGINISKHNTLIQLADELTQQSKNFNKDLFQQYLFGKEGLEAFKADVQQTKNYNINRFPTLILRSEEQSVIITGYRPYSALMQAIQQLSPGIKPTKKIKSGKEYKEYWSTITSREVDEALK